MGYRVEVPSSRSSVGNKYSLVSQNVLPTPVVAGVSELFVTGKLPVDPLELHPRVCCETNISEFVWEAFRDVRRRIESC